ncbi:MAG: hypothetical protein ACHQ50_07720 [Fimbriimonadales bacterium]
MMSRKRLWIAVGALCALAVGVAYLARPEDELAAMMRLHPTIENLGLEATAFTFPSGSTHVLASIPGPRVPYPLIHDHAPLLEIILPSGRIGDFYSGKHGTCQFVINGPDAPWYQRAWSTIKHRLGL